MMGDGTSVSFECVAGVTELVIFRIRVEAAVGKLERVILSNADTRVFAELEIVVVPSDGVLVVESIIPFLETNGGDSGVLIGDEVEPFKLLE